MNRAFLYGDLLFETIRMVDGELLYADKHFSRMVYGASQLHFETRSLELKDLTDACMAAATKAGLRNARIRFVVYRNAGGFYTPESDTVSYYAEATALSEAGRIYRQVGIYDECSKPVNKLSGIKSGNALLYVMAGIYAREKKLDDAIILNHYGRLCEAVSSNIFMVKDGMLVTPALSEGCVRGVMREVVLDHARELKMTVQEGMIGLDALSRAEEVFFTNAVHRIVPLERWNGRKLGQSLSTQLLSAIR